jgi:heterodisulfide reductase subunit A
MSEAKRTIRVGVYICHCGHNIGAVVDCKAVADYAANLPNVTIARDYKYMCSDPGQEMVQQDIKGSTGSGGGWPVVLRCCTSIHSVKRAGSRGLNPFTLPDGEHPRARFVGTHRQGCRPEKAKDLVRAAVRRVVLHKPLERRQVGSTRMF